MPVPVRGETEPATSRVSTTLATSVQVLRAVAGSQRPNSPLPERTPPVVNSVASRSAYTTAASAPSQPTQTGQTAPRGIVSTANAASIAETSGAHMPMGEVLEVP